MNPKDKLKLEQNREVTLFQSFAEFSMLAKNTDKFLSINVDSNRIYLAHNKVENKMIDVAIDILKSLKKEIVREKKN